MGKPRTLPKVKKNFGRFGTVKKREVFSLSCFEYGQLEDAPSWDLKKSTLDEKIDYYMDCLYGSYFADVKRSGDERAFIAKNFSHGDLTNAFLAWYIEDQTDYRCDFEWNGGGCTFDVEIFENERPVCDIELKRCATSGQIRNYLQSHRKKHTNDKNADTNLLINYFPVAESMNTNRVSDFIDGYTYVSQEIHGFFCKDETHVVSFPAPIGRDPKAKNPLEETLDLVRYAI